MDIEEKAEENQEQQQPDFSSFVEDAFELETKQAEINQRGEKNKEIIVKRFIGNVGSHDRTVGPEPVREKEGGPQEDEEIMGIGRVPVAQEDEKAQDSKVACEVLDPFRMKEGHGKKHFNQSR